MLVEELITELQKCNQKCEVLTFNKVTGAIEKLQSVDGIRYKQTVFLNIVNNVSK